MEQTHNIPVTTSILFTIAACVIASLSIRQLNRRRKPFPFQKLPLELRILVLENVVEEDEQRAAAEAIRNKNNATRGHPHVQPSDVVVRIKARLPTIMLNTLFPRKPSTGSIMSLVSRSFRKEYLHAMLRRGSYAFTLSAALDPNDAIWHLRDDVLSSIARLDLVLHAKPENFIFDPRTAVPGTWLLRKHLLRWTARMPHLRRLRITIVAGCNQIWNPAWLWHFCGHEFKSVGGAGAKRTITFELEDMRLSRPNELRKGARRESAWEWWCPRGHFLKKDPTDVTGLTTFTSTIRPFCNVVYQPCKICEPDEEDEEEEAEDDEPAVLAAEPWDWDIDMNAGRT